MGSISAAALTNFDWQNDSPFRIKMPEGYLIVVLLLPPHISWLRTVRPFTILFLENITPLSLWGQCDGVRRFQAMRQATNREKAAKIAEKDPFGPVDEQLDRSAASEAVNTAAMAQVLSQM